MLLADHPKLFQGWELDPASDSQILVEPASDSFGQVDSASESIDGQSSGLEKSHMTLKVKQEEDSKESQEAQQWEESGLKESQTNFVLESMKLRHRFF